MRWPLTRFGTALLVWLLIGVVSAWLLCKVGQPLPELQPLKTMPAPDGGLCSIEPIGDVPV